MRAIWIAALLLVFEIIMLVYQYFYTAVFAWSFVFEMLLRILITTALCLLLHDPLQRSYLGRGEKRQAHSKRRKIREVKAI